MNIEKDTLNTLYMMVEKGLKEVAAKGELKTKDEVCLLKELLSAHEKLEKEEEYTEGYSTMPYYPGRVARDGRMNGMPGGNSTRDGWYITREDDRAIRGNRYGYNSYGEPSMDRIVEAVRTAMRENG